ncbi:YbbR-like domain-containing protein [Hoylesella buccalis]|uniref:YbbR-like domain-containing protein n=1 Tax=Hoylesella buccalis TaxID=28127 RepID=UPI0026EFE013|nr:YbbR-like domain-containing protein [Hoylesella buccalis]
MLNQLKRITAPIRNFLLDLVSKRFLVFLFFLFLSAAFWLSMTLDEMYEKEIPVPIRLVNVPKNIIITTNMPDTVIVTVRDKGFAFMGYFTGEPFRPINLNFSTYANESAGRGSVPLADVQNILYQRLATSSRITALKPDQLKFYFNFGQSKTLPVRANGIMTPAINYYLARVSFWPEKVTVYAQQSKLDSLRYIMTEKLNLTNFTDTLIRQVNLQKIIGVKTVPEKVKIGLFPDILTEESIEVPIKAINMPKGKTLRTFPSKVKVLFNIGVTAFRKINEKQFEVVVDYNELQANQSDKCALHLKTVPAEVRQARLEMNQIDYLVEQQ